MWTAPKGKDLFLQTEKRSTLFSSFSDDWGSVFGDPTKFGLGLFSVLFDILFILQHYVFYR